MASTDVLSQTLSSITSIKLEEISRQQTEFEAAKAEILQSIKSQSDRIQKVRVLLKGVQHLNAVGKLKKSTSLPLANIDHFLQQADRDPSVSSKILGDWESKLRKELDVHSLKYKYATLYSHLVKEWLAGNEQLPTKMGISNQHTFENVGRKEMHDQRRKWEELVFNAKLTNSNAIQTRLEKLFSSSDDIKSAFQSFWKATKSFEDSMASIVHFDETSLTWVIQGLLRSDAVSDQKCQVLKDFLHNKVVMAEVADVLNMRMTSLKKWKWDPAGTGIEQRLNLNGRYRFYADEDLLQTILLRYIGMKWSVHFKTALTTFRNATNVWIPPTERIPSTDRKRRGFFLYPEREHVESTVEGLRSKHFKNDIFLEQLPDALSEARGGYDDDLVKENDTRRSGQQITQTLLHTLATEIIMLTRLGEDVTVVRTDFAWFGPSLPHSTIFAVLKFFKVSDYWIDFFRRTIEAPVRFLVDGINAPVRIRKRGTPVSGPLSDFLAEVVLFCFDFAFNQYTGGLTLYRLHDDIWFWGNEGKCVKGWELMTDFSKLMGLEFSEEKTGSTKVSHKNGVWATPASSLPKGDVKWGFLRLDPRSGRFLINGKQVDNHIEELRHQLDNCTSILDWIQAWNIYGVRFFTTNFGKPASCYGLAHVEMLLETFARIQAKLFSSTGGSVTSTLKKMIGERFGVDDIPEGYLFFPLSMGGLDVQNPFVNLYLIREAITKNPQSYMDEFFSEEGRRYEIAKKRFEDDGGYGRSSVSKLFSADKFMTRDEYSRYRLQTSVHLFNAYNNLLEVPQEVDIAISSDVAGILDDIDKSQGQPADQRGIGDAWSRFQPYQRWIIELYASDMIARFGSLNVIEKGLLPTGMVTMFRESRFEWQG